MHRGALPAVTALAAFGVAALAAGLGRGVLTTYLPVALDRISDAPGLIGTVMLVNVATGFAVPLWVGLWSDRLRARGHGRTMPFILGGALLTAGGLLAVAFGTGTTYLVLALCAAVAYTGLNALTTAHRALVPEVFPEDERPEAVGAQELAMLLGGGPISYAVWQDLFMQGWMRVATLLFAAILGINRLFVAEREEGGFDAIRLAPIDRTALFFAKAAALLAYLVALELVVVPVFAVFFLDSAAALPPLALVLLLADLGLAATGTLISSMAVNSRARDLLTPLVLLPLAVPLSIAATGALEPLLAVGGPGYHRFGTWLAVLGLYDLVFLLVGYAVFDFLVED